MRGVRRAPFFYLGFWFSTWKRTLLLDLIVFWWSPWRRDSRYFEAGSSCRYLCLRHCSLDMSGIHEMCSFVLSFEQQQIRHYFDRNSSHTCLISHCVMAHLHFQLEMHSSVGGAARRTELPRLLCDVSVASQGRSSGGQALTLHAHSFYSQVRAGFGIRRPM